MEANQQNQIEAYLSGEMNADQLSKFEADVHVNPELRQELNFQSEVIQGIGEYRKTQLVARLDALNISPAWWSFIQQSSTLQYIGVSVVAGIVGTGIWFAVQDDNPTVESISDKTEIVVDAPVQKESEWNLPELKEQEPVNSSSKEQVSEPAEKKIIIESKKSFNPVVAVPSAGDVEAEKEFVPESAGEQPDMTNTETVKSQPVEIEIVESNTAKVKYRYYEGKLYLYGKFQQNPYEILEINSATGRRIYLYHMESFYPIVPSDKPVDLEIVTNTKLIQELSILRKTK